MRFVACSFGASNQSLKTTLNQVSDYQLQVYIPLAVKRCLKSGAAKREPRCLQRATFFEMQQKQSRTLLKDWFNSPGFNLMPLIHRFVFVPPKIMPLMLGGFMVCESMSFELIQTTFQIQVLSLNIFMRLGGLFNCRETQFPHL